MTKILLTKLSYTYLRALNLIYIVTFLYINKTGITFCYFVHILIKSINN